MIPKKNPHVLIGLIVFLILAAGFLVIWMMKPATTNALENGTNYLQAQQNKDLSGIEQQIAQIREQELMDAIAQGKTSIFSLFDADNSVILGDSRAKGFEEFGFLDANHVLAKIGVSIYDIDDELEQIKTMQPGVVYIAYGANDLEGQIGGDSATGYADIVEQYVDKILEVSPQSRIVLSSILEFTDGAVANQPNLGNVDNYNAQLKALAEKRGWGYADNSTITNHGSSDYYAQDGIHFSSEFYPLWAMNLLKASGTAIV